MSLQIGVDVGPYTVVRPARRASRHGRADGANRPPRVWCAEPTAGGDPVALITDPPPTRRDRPDDRDADDRANTSPAEQPSTRSTLRREWALSGSLRHPHLVTVHDLLDTPDGLVLATEWADGGSVTDLLRRSGRLTAGQTVTLLAGICRALTACHERGLVHGDVTTDTVLVAGDGRPMLARIGRCTAAADSGQTCPAEPRCASPDVARGRAATVVDDVFALGATAMQCLVGRPAWPAQDLRDVVIQSEFGQWPTIPPSAGAGVELTALVDAMLDADPVRRPAVREVLARLADCPPPEPLLGGVAGERRPGPADRGRHAAPAAPATPTVPAAVTMPVGPASFPTAPASVPAPRRPDSGRHSRVPLRGGRWRGAVRPVVVLVLIAASAVAAGVWWAGADRPAVATLAADEGPGPAEGAPSDTAPSDTAPSDTAPSDTAQTVTAADWAAVIGDLDRQRAAAFAAADPSLLGQVYASGAPGLAEDRARIEDLRSAGLRVDGLAHEITAVETVTATATGSTVAVTDVLPAATILDASGVMVGSTTPVGQTRRLVTVTAVDGGYRIATVALDPG